VNLAFMYLLRVVENGKTTVEKRENGKLVSKLVDGQAIAIDGGKPGLTM
jgi:hypothetical protein